MNSPAPARAATSYRTHPERMNELQSKANDRNKSTSDMIDRYVALGLIFEDLLADGKKEILLVDKEKLDEIRDKTIIPVKMMLDHR